MKIFLLAALLIMFLQRIKNTPMNLSEKIFTRKTEQCIAKIKEQIKNIKATTASYSDVDIDKILRYIILIFVSISYVFYIVVYLLIASHFNNEYILILSTLEIIFTWYGMYNAPIGEYFISINVKDYMFSRRYNLLNMILDYVYYPVCIWMLLK